MKATRATANKFLKNHTIAVLATLSESGVVSTTPITYAMTPQGKLRFATRDETTKYLDISHNDKIALSVVDKSKPISVNMTGVAKVIEDLTEIRDTLRTVSAIFREDDDIPHILKFQRGDFVVIEIEPTRLQYTDFTKDQGESAHHIVDL